MTDAISVGEGGECEPAWLPTFGGLPGADWRVRAIAVFDDGLGGGLALYVAGHFSVAGGRSGTRGIARWDGSSWSSVGGGLNGIAYSLIVHDDGLGGGPALYVSGNFTMAGDVAASCIARWDGSLWSALGSGFTTSAPSVLAVFDDGTGGGPALYLGGLFSNAGGSGANNIARWDGASWSPVGGGTNQQVSSFAVFDDGSGPALYVGGSFTSAGSPGGEISAIRIARWNGSAWSTVGSGMNGQVLALTVYDDGLGGGPALYAGGGFTTAGGVSANHIARWNGTNWSALGAGTAGWVRALAVHDDGSGAGLRLYAAGNWMSSGLHHIRIWNGASWSGIVGVNNPVDALAVWDDGSGSPALFAGGDFTAAGGIGAERVAKWSGSPAGWSRLGDGPNRAVLAFETWDDGGGPALFVAGQFTTIGGIAASRIARWSGLGGTWSPLGSGTGGQNPDIRALAVFDDGSGEALYAAGLFTTAGGVNANRVARWNGTSWSAVGAGLNGMVNALAVFDDGSGPALYAGGSFITSGFVTVNNIARWNGTSWSALSGGVDAGVFALDVFDDGSGSGPALIVAGNFTSAGGKPVNRIAKWDGTEWHDIGVSGATPLFNTVKAFDDGLGPALYAGGSFAMSGLTYIARWDGSSWSGLAGGTNDNVIALSVYDDGTGGGPALYVGGRFTSAGGVEASGIAKWDAVTATWSTLSDGLTGVGGAPAVAALAVFDAGEGPALIAGGNFRFSESGDSYAAHWQGCTASPECALADLNCDGAVDVLDLLILLDAWGECKDCSDAGGCPADLNGDCAVDVLDLLILLDNWG